MTEEPPDSFDVDEAIIWPEEEQLIVSRMAVAQHTGFQGERWEDVRERLARLLP